jgi:hypothetical protein
MYLMWFDASKRPAAEKAAEAIEAYREKHAREPREIVVNPAMAAEIGDALGAFPLLTRAVVQRNVVYVGDND